MLELINKTWISAALVFGLGIFAEKTIAAPPSVAKALSLQPTQRGVDYDRPNAEQQKTCKIDLLKRDKLAGWIVRNGDQQLLRRFLDTNADNQIDQWCYYKNGVEVYRDIDSNFNGKADQCRWLGTEGMRWGIDTNEDNKIDQWKAISAEEVSMEVIEALRTRDLARFQRLLLTSAEAKSLGMSSEQQKSLETKVSRAQQGFAGFAQQQRTVTQASRWVHFGGVRPGVIPAGTDGSSRDLVVYDNVVAVLETNGEHSQISIGTLIQVGSVWRLIDLPHAVTDGHANNNGGFFFQASMTRPIPDRTTTDVPRVDQRTQKLLSQFEQIEQQLATTNGNARIATLHGQRADVLEQLAAAASQPDERANWIRQFADTVSGAFQIGEYPQGLDRLKKLALKLNSEKSDADTLAYVTYRYMNAEYTRDLQAPNADLAKIQTEWLKNLKAFVTKYSKTEHAADAMLQLALAEEFAGRDREAGNWYRQIARDFPQTSMANKANGALRRLASVGKTIPLQGKTPDGRAVNLSAYRGKVVLIHYWATWCEPCKQELATLRDLQAKYGRRGFSLIGVSVDNQRSDLVNYLRTARLSWPQLYEEGGLDGRLATELGIVTLPTMILVGQDGRVIRRNITAAELDGELRKVLR